MAIWKEKGKKRWEALSCATHIYNHICPTASTTSFFPAATPLFDVAKIQIINLLLLFANTPISTRYIYSEPNNPPLAQY
jgi:hypothetical protein